MPERSDPSVGDGRDTATRPGGTGLGCGDGADQGTALGVTCWVGHGGDALAMTLFGDGPGAMDASWGWKVLAIGGERRATASACASRLGAAEAGSLRDVARTAAAVHLILGRDMPGEADLDALLEGERLVVGTAPMPATTVEAHRLGERAARVRTVPMFRWSETCRIAQPMLEEFLADGAPSSISIRMRSADEELGIRGVDAMLADACDLALDVLPGVESVMAVGRSPSHAADPRILAVVGRGADGSVLAMDLADVGGWERSIELTGPAGRLRIADDAAERWDRSGTRTERLECGGARHAAMAVVESLRTLARTRGGRIDAGRVVAQLALADAARLSVRTGNAESPASVEELAARP